MYKITNNINGKVYIGQTTSKLERRWKQHCNKSSCCKKLKAAITKYGSENFSIETLWSGTGKRDVLNSCLDAMEIAFINHYNSIENGYNLLKGGSGHYIPTVSENTRRKLSQARKGIKLSQEIRQKISNAQKGKKLSEETICKMSKYGKSDGRRTQLVPLWEKRKKAVYQYSLDGTLVKMWNSIAEAARNLNLSASTISAVVNNKRNLKTCGGFIWKI